MARLARLAHDPQAATVFADPLGSFFGRFLLPGGRPRRLICDIQAGGRPRRLPRPRASRSKVMIASSTCSRSILNSASILLMSIHPSPEKIELLKARLVRKNEQERVILLIRNKLCTSFLVDFQASCSVNRTRRCARTHFLYYPVGD